MKRVLHWHRTDLRLHDNPALQTAIDLCSGKGDCLYPVWTWDPHYLKQQRDSMNNVSQNYTKLNSKSQLFVIRGSPQTIFPKLFEAWKITHLVFERDDCPYTKARDQAVTSAAEKAGVEVISKLGHTLFWAEDVIKANKGKPPLAHGAYTKVVDGTLGTPDKPLDAPTQLPDPGSTDLKGVSMDDQGLELYKDYDVNAPSRKSDDRGYDSLAGPGGKFAVPTMEEIGMQEATSPHRGGEDVALQRLEEYMKDKDAVIHFEKPKTDPSAFDPASTTILSPYLKFGCLSPRLFYWRLREITDKASGASGHPVSLEAQLYWREMFHTAMYSTDNWNQMRGNPIARYIDWRLENQYDKDGKKLPYDQWELDEQDKIGEELFSAWKQGRTGYPWIDAVMRQLRQEGWIHHLARHAVACFLTRGHCFVSWERGEEVFDEYLVDWDPAMNGGNWMWLSCTAFFSQFYRVYSPVAFGKKQPNGKAYVRKYVPEVAGLPDKYLFEPWKAPLDVQDKAQCKIGKDYPHPIVAEDAKEHVIDKIKAAYDAKLHGDAKEVMDGSAKQKLRDAFPLETPTGFDAAPANPPQREPASPARKRKGAVTDGVEQSAEDAARHGKQRKLSFGK